MAIQVHESFTPERQAAFVELVANAHSLSGAAKLVGISRETAYQHYRHDPNFKTLIDEAIKARGDYWEDRLRVLGELGRPDTLGVIIGLKKEGRFIEPQYAQKLQINVQVNTPFQGYSAEQLRELEVKLERFLEATEVKALEAGDPDAVEG